MTPAMLRRALIYGLPEVQAQDGTAPAAAQVYVPNAHARALALDCSLVIGARGVGKTFWWEALRRGEVRSRLAGTVKSIDNVTVGTGFGIGVSIDDAPDRETFARLIAPESGFTAYDVWRTVCVRWIGRLLDLPRPSQSWRESVSAVSSDPEMYARLLEQANKVLGEQARHGLLIFDALDRTSNDWRTTDPIVRDLLRFALDLRSYQYLHAKVFLRQDQFEGRSVKDFTDASKLLATRVELTWGSLDLNGLLWQYLLNTPADISRPIVDLLTELGCPINGDADVREVPQRLRHDESLQKAAFARLAGQYMGRDRRRGIPYTWIVSHLSDSQGRASPRSFLAALRHAAVNTSENHPEHATALHYDAIKEGVRAASGIRVDEMAEDYPWIRHLMQPLRGMSVPCSFDNVAMAWSTAKVLDQLGTPDDRLPPEHLDQGPEGVREDLEKLGLLQRMRDGRVNMPDLYRVGFGLGRRGGVKPAARE
ncbi:MAG: hypothetical protein CMO30_22165 [Tistrella sp.]|uniref:Uncharacterized protein n=1 Tax=Tistrella mobilis TaxID=171437 RepID=A0A3B9IUD6_9PROT|nr:hypothetical protein [Tistrella sp.]MAD37331.1 hypothetical protein [Tistrella sp.]MBA77986.1 hypothetical protein [Tistrella sp.]HAE51491.1 hypothetical protein [Tistrella mobilis]